MFPTEFTYVNSTYRLIVDSTLAIQTAAWVDRQGVVYDRYFSHEGFCKFIFISAPEEAIHKIHSKYPLFSVVPATPVEEPSPHFDKAQRPQCPPVYKFVVRGDMPESDMIYNCYWVECESPEAAGALALELEESINTCWNISAEGCCVHFQDPDFEDGMVPSLYYQLVQRFGKPINQDVLRDIQTYSDLYFFDDCYTPEAIKSRYRQLSKLHHPDCGGDTETFVALSEQYSSAIAGLEFS